MANDLKRLPRLSAILTYLQAGKLVTAPFLAKKFGVNVRTIYRDIRALEESGVPVVTEEGRGYSLVEGYRIPPVMFTEREAFALITAEQIISRYKDASFVTEFTNAITKIKSVLLQHSKLRADLLAESMYIGKNFGGETTTNSLIDMQLAVTGQRLIFITYQSGDNPSSQRQIDPYLLYHSDDGNWVLVAFCHLRNDFRSFRLDRITQYSIQSARFLPDQKAFHRFIERKFLT